MYLSKVTKYLYFVTFHHCANFCGPSVFQAKSQANQQRARMSLKEFITLVDVAKKSGYKNHGSTLVLSLSLPR